MDNIEKIIILELNELETQCFNTKNFEEERVKLIKSFEKVPCPQCSHSLIFTESHLKCTHCNYSFDN